MKVTLTSERLQSVLFCLFIEQATLHIAFSSRQSTVLGFTDKYLFRGFWPLMSALVATAWMFVTTYYINEDINGMTRLFAAQKQATMTFAGSWPFIWALNWLVKQQSVNGYRYIRLRTIGIGLAVNIVAAMVVHLYFKGTSNPFWSIANSALWSIPGMMLLVIPAYNALQKPAHTL